MIMNRAMTWIVEEGRLTSSATGQSLPRYSSAKATSFNMARTNIETFGSSSDVIRPSKHRKPRKKRAIASRRLAQTTSILSLIYHLWCTIKICRNPFTCYPGMGMFSNDISPTIFEDLKTMFTLSSTSYQYVHLGENHLKCQYYSNVSSRWQRPQGSLEPNSIPRLRQKRR